MNYGSDGRVGGGGGGEGGALATAAAAAAVTAFPAEAGGQMSHETPHPLHKRDDLET